MNHWVAPRPKIDLALVGHAVRMMDMSVNGGENVGIVSRLAPRGGSLWGYPVRRQLHAIRTSGVSHQSTTRRRTLTRSLAARSVELFLY
jgi:hypothetical protein